MNMMNLATKHIIFFALLALAANSASAQGVASKTTRKELPKANYERKWSRSTVNGCEIIVGWLEYEQGANNSYDIEVNRCSHLMHPTMAPAERQWVLSKILRCVNRQKLNDIVQSALHLQADKNVSVRYFIDKEGKMYRYRTTLDSCSLRANSPTDFARVIEGVEQAKIFPAWRDVCPTDSVEYGYTLSIPITMSTTKPIIR